MRPSTDFVNGLTCVDSKKVQADSFFFAGLHKVGNTSNKLGSAITPVTVAQLTGLNTLGLSMARFDYGPGGIAPPHHHPRASEIIVVLEGMIEVAFVISNPDNKLYKKVLQKGDAYVFPIGLIHYQKNVGKGNAVSLSGLSSQNPGVIFEANTVFGSTPDIAADLLAKSFQVDQKVVDQLQTVF